MKMDNLRHLRHHKPGKEMKSSSIRWLICAAPCLFAALTLQAEELVTLKTRTGVEQKFILMKPEAPTASVILFTGGKGNLNLDSLSGVPLINRGKKNFLVRTRDLFKNNGFMVAVVDAPTDKQAKVGMFGEHRNSKEYVVDIDHVIENLRKRVDMPVWLIGTSRGTESVVNIAIHSKQKPDGIVLTSSISVPNSHGTAITEMDLAQIRVPTLILAHLDDSCRLTPPYGARKVAGRILNSPRVKVKFFKGGNQPISKPCKARTYHGFFGIERQVVDYISSFIRAN